MNNSDEYYNALEKLYNTYRKRICVGEKSLVEIFTFLNEKGEIVELKRKDISHTYFASFLYNVIHFDAVPIDSYDVKKKDIEKKFEMCLKNPKEIIEENGYDIGIFKFPKGKNNMNFYRQYVPYEREREIYFIFEKKTKYYYCNCIKLFSEIGVFKGVSNDDVKNRTINLLQHLSCIETLNK